MNDNTLGRDYLEMALSYLPCENDPIFLCLRIALDNLQEEDFFGTEGQCDPRGDFRDIAEYEGNLREVNKDNFHNIIRNILKMDDEEIEIINQEILSVIKKSWEEESES